MPKHKQPAKRTVRQDPDSAAKIRIPLLPEEALRAALKVRPKAKDTQKEPHPAD